MSKPQWWKLNYYNADRMHFNSGKTNVKKVM